AAPAPGACLPGGVGERGGWVDGRARPFLAPATKTPGGGGEGGCAPSRSPGTPGGGRCRPGGLRGAGPPAAGGVAGRPPGPGPAPRPGAGGRGGGGAPPAG